MIEPFTQPITGRKVLQPACQRQPFLPHTTRPDSVHQEAQAVSFCHGIVNAFDLNHGNIVAESRQKTGRRRLCSPTSRSPARKPASLKSFGQPLLEATHPRPISRGEQAFVRTAKVPLLGGVRGGFMVSMHVQKRKEALHEPCGSGRKSVHSSLEKVH